MPLLSFLQGVVDIGQRMNVMNEKIRHLGPFGLLGDSLGLILQVATIELHAESVCFVRYNTWTSGSEALHSNSLPAVNRGKNCRVPGLHSTVSRLHSSSLRACFADNVVGLKELPFGSFPYSLEEEEIIIRTIESGCPTSACVLSQDSAPWLHMRTELL